ncbi:unnamed protein product [Bursaphelenchus xylophilus]|uniref:(pine wood nematode) hypothetical protein n=1 Tax=Bursaphelenchus xylophilus TaxID=6326 RepID=A0A1I7RVQ6_BURXY|nr:unnamed protein product [Bursaphelenchus xylophilus]CAG9082012.1 unnamed protein product [Bursaphelenchus xylophilus]
MLKSASFFPLIFLIVNGQSERTVGGKIRCENSNLSGKSMLTFQFTTWEFRECSGLDIIERIKGTCDISVFMYYIDHNPTVNPVTGEFTAKYTPRHADAPRRKLSISHECDGYCRVHEISEEFSGDVKTDYDIVLSSGDPGAYVNQGKESLYFCNGNKYP